MSIDRAIEETIRKAMEEGKFENLSGKGKPLNLQENPYADPAWSAAYRLLQQNGFSLPWLEERKELEAAAEALRRKIRHPLNAAQQTALQAEIHSLNRRIMDYNLKPPSPVFHMRLLSLQLIEPTGERTPSEGI